MHAGTKDNEEEVTTSSSSSNKFQIAWQSFAWLTLSHVGALYGAYLFFTTAKWQTCCFTFFLYLATMVSVTAGAHRLWSHKAYKATLPLRVLLLWFYTMAFQFSAFSWALRHRMHHKYCDTDSDPHNAKRGFFFSHMGWIMAEKHPDVISKMRSIDMTDLSDDPLLRFQHKHFVVLAIILCFIWPTYIATLWGEEIMVAFYVAAVFRVVFTLHATWLINSVAHMWGTKPYDKDIMPVENKMVSFFTAGEGFHNYHHTFPWDYKTAELGGYSLNLTKIFIEVMAKVGWAYDLKSVSEEMIEKRVMRTGDGTHPVWGWDDQDLYIENKLYKN